MTDGWYPDEFEPDFEVPIGRPRDREIDEAKDVLLRDIFAAQPDRVFYGRQIELFVERRFFHWITTRALGELAEERRIGSRVSEIREGLVVRFYWSKRNRYWRRAAARIGELVSEYAADRVGRALGNHGEMMFDAALPKVGFMPRGEDVQEWAGRRWEKTGHDLDRVIERDGVLYGVEIKNALDYIERVELVTKLEMCAVLGLRPLFIMRFAPKNYIEMVRQAGGFTLLFEYQMYPPGYEALAQRLKDELGLKVGWPSQVGTGTVQRFLSWHQAQLRKG